MGVVVPAAGAGRRMGGARKPFLELEGEPLLLRALRPFLAHPSVTAVRIALAPEDAADPPPWLTGLDGRIGLVEGGRTRTRSVAAALAALPDGVEIVLVHDAARPLVTRAVLDRCLTAASAGVGAVAGWPATDTLKEVDEDGRVVGTPDRRRIWHAQTPQAFPASLLRRAYATLDGDDATDDATLVERVGGTVVMVEGSASNLKVTRPEDLPLAALLLRLAGDAP
ncbi:MAG: 2-C-methyl-D-erythritol 4-phosphate cytidylyltransferase [Gemmatimonadetes bacterium]|nr:2-C-methyl-D-erythritol 4-phosphate cytidylyltransferase [Gemmatimonadota bacterium]